MEGNFSAFKEWNDNKIIKVEDTQDIVERLLDNRHINFKEALQLLNLKYIDPKYQKLKTNE